jgi:hypothetical protein
VAASLRIGGVVQRERILTFLDVARQRGLEIGPLDRPIVTRDMGPVEYVDRARRDELVHTYGATGEVDPQRIVDVDHVWGEQRLVECVGGVRAYDYLLASHVIEHVPDLFGWLQEIGEVLVDGGLGVFVVPDRRYTFDVRRRTSGEAEFLDAYVRGLRRPDARQVFDCFFHQELLDRRSSSEEVERTYLARHLLDVCRRAEAGEYVDAHCWVFTPRSLLGGLELASRLLLLPFEIVALLPPERGDIDFLLVLRRLPADMPAEAQHTAFRASRDRLRLPDEGEVAATDARMLAEAQAAIARTAAIEASTSWRMTAPLRRAVTLARRLGRAGARPARRVR